MRPGCDAGLGTLSNVSPYQPQFPLCKTGRFEQYHLPVLTGLGASEPAETGSVGQSWGGIREMPNLLSVPRVQGACEPALTKLSCSHSPGHRGG